MKLFLISLFFLPLPASPQLQVAKIFSDNMVLQRDKPATIWGKGLPGREVIVSFGNETKNEAIKADSSWMISFKKQKANRSSQSIIIRSGEDRIELKNILVGDLWLCIGQSNMQWPLAQEMHFRKEIGSTDQPLLRLYNPTYAGEDIYNNSFSDSVISLLNTNDFYKGVWEQSDSNSCKSMSAVGYYFGKTILTSENVPVGLIDLAIGGAPVETFISRSALQNDPRFGDKAQSNWLDNTALPVWIRERAQQNLGVNQADVKNEPGPNHGFKPGFAFASGIEPILSLPIKGIIWYQGESNAEEIERVNEYRELMKLMIRDYRARWQQPGLPFYFVQLSSVERPLWPQFRDEQRKLLSEIKNTGMAVSSDIGERNNVHPTNKKTVGERLGKWALNKTYGRKKIIPSGPLPLKAIYKDGQVIIFFQYTARGLKINGATLKGFSLDGQSATPAIIKNKAVVIAAKEKPGFVYYGWQPFTEANLVNSELLPASTFKIKVE